MANAAKKRRAVSASREGLFFEPVPSRGRLVWLLGVFISTQRDSITGRASVGGLRRGTTNPRPFSAATTGFQGLGISRRSGREFSQHARPRRAQPASAAKT